MSDLSTLEAQLRNELTSIPIEHWRFFFPAAVATWRFIQSEHPGILGELSAGFDSEPWFSGPGASWFGDSVINDEVYLDSVEAIMDPVIRALPQHAIRRGFPYSHELPPIPSDAIERLASRIAEIVLQRGPGPN